ncbi:MAG: DUF2652 domain-containing protein [Saprospiraceae bacterium]|nr:DUF2652 domain-containing protein [Saprospiraceae bacterium]
MAERATILIPDISGFTEFTGTTELDHAAHIINELLELIISSNDLGFTLAEVEGDAVLFYLKEDTPDPQTLVALCLRIFENFHRRLKVIARDTVCQCGACQGAVDLTLKFIVHHGEIKEIKVAHFIKTAGIDMILAHRLMKNSIDSDEYILMTHQCIDRSGRAMPAEQLEWNTANDAYQVIGTVPYAYALLSDVKHRIPAPPELEEFVVVKGDDNLEVEINKPLDQVYQTLINVDERKDWMIGVDKIDRDPVTERIGMQHNCQFMGMTMINTCLHHAYSQDTAVYVEQVEVPEMSLDTVDYYDLTLKDHDRTHLNFNINWKETPLPDEHKQGMLQGIKSNLESLKAYIEGK